MERTQSRALGTRHQASRNDPRCSGEASWAGTLRQERTAHTTQHRSRRRTGRCPRGRTDHRQFAVGNPSASRGRSRRGTGSHCPGPLRRHWPRGSLRRARRRAQQRRESCRTSRALRPGTRARSKGRSKTPRGTAPRRWGTETAAGMQPGMRRTPRWKRRLGSPRGTPRKAGTRRGTPCTRHRRRSGRATERCIRSRSCSRADPPRSRPMMWRSEGDGRRGRTRH